MYHALFTGMETKRVDCIYTERQLPRPFFNMFDEIDGQGFPLGLRNGMRPSFEAGFTSSRLVQNTIHHVSVKNL